MSVESTVDYAGFAVGSNGGPLTDRAVTLKRVDTLATLGSTVTDSNGKWFFNDIAATPEVQAEISAGTTPQVAVKKCWSGDVWSLYVREKLTAAPAALFNLPPLANIYANSVLLTTALQTWGDARYLNVAGDTLTGPLLLPNGTLANPALAFTSDPNTGLIRSGEGIMAVVTNGVSRASFGATGLDVVGDLSVAADSTFGGTIDVTGAGIVHGYFTADGGLLVTGLSEFRDLVLLPNGTATDPALTFAADMSCGIYRVAAATVGIAGQLNAGAILATGTVSGANFATLGTLNAATVIATGSLLQAGVLGFYGASGQAKPTVSGAKGGNAALTSLCAALATLGLITNSTS